MFPIPCRRWGIYFGHKDFSSLHIEHLELANVSSDKGYSTWTRSKKCPLKGRSVKYWYSLSIPRQNSHTEKVFMSWSNWSVFRSISYNFSCFSYQVQLHVIQWAISKTFRFEDFHTDQWSLIWPKAPILEMVSRKPHFYEKLTITYFIKDDGRICIHYETIHYDKRHIFPYKKNFI